MSPKIKRTIEIEGATEDEWLRLVRVFHRMATAGGCAGHKQAADWTAIDNRVVGEFKEGSGTIYIFE